MAELSSTTPAGKQLDILRGNSPLAAHEFLQVLSAFIFLRWADFQEAELEAVAAFDDTPYEPILPPFLHWRTWHQLPAAELYLFLTERLPASLQQLQNFRHNPLATHLHRLADPLHKLAGLRPEQIGSLILWLAEQPFETPSDRRQLLATFDGLLEAGQDKHSGEYRTPRHIAGLMVALAAPVQGESIYDPCFGTAGLLTMAIDQVLQKATQNNGGFAVAGLDISGIEINTSAYLIGLTRLALAGSGDPQLELGNSLERTPSGNLQQDGFDLVLANPPWGWTARLDERYGLEHYPVMTKDATGLFLQHALANLRANGRAVIAVPNGVLFRSGAEYKLRRWLLDHHNVEAVIALPERAFMPTTAIKSSLLVLRRGNSTRKVRMVDAEPFFEKGKGRQPATISEEGSFKLAEAIRNVEPSEFCWDVELKVLAESKFDLTPRRRDQSGLDTTLEALRPSVEVVTLKDCCRIATSRQIPVADLVDERPEVSSPLEQQPLFKENTKNVEQQSLSPSAEPIPYIRIRDIHKGQAGKGSSWLSAATAQKVEPGWKLRAGDVLFSKSGTIGKIGVVRNGAIGAIAASGLYVLRADNNRLDPHYLAAYLDSSECRAWLQDRATGAVISHLGRPVIYNTPIPLPPLQIQQRVAAAWREHGVDALTYLARLLTDGEEDPIVAWLEKELKTFPADPESLTDPLALGPLDELADRVRPLRNEAAHGRHGDNTLLPWILSFNEAVSPLRGVNDIPHGPGLLSVLQESGLGLLGAKDAVSGHLPSEEKARKLTDIVSKWLSRAITVLFHDVQLVFSAETSTFISGEFQEFDLKVQNGGPLPLRKVMIVFEPEWGQGNIKYLAENGVETIGLKADPPKTAGPFTLVARWSALALDGQQVDGAREIAFDVLPAAQPKEDVVQDLGASPYVCGDPIRPERNDVFFGREELLDQIRRQIVQSGNVVLLEGNRRAGKSSILRHLEGVGPIQGWLGVYCSLQGAEGSQDGVGVPTAAVFREIAISIAKAMVPLGIEVPLPDGSTLPPGKKIGIARACRQGISEEHSFADFRDYAEMALETMEERQLGILLMLDEFDKLQEGIDNGVTSPQVPENIRFLVQTYPGFSAILTGSRRLKRLRDEYWSALFGLGTRFGVTSLSLEAARHLVTEPVKGRLVYSREAAEWAIVLTNRQPFLLQSLCNRIFDMAAQLKHRSITLEMVNEAAALLADDNEHFRSLWTYSGSDRRRFILGLINKETDGADPLRFGVLRELLSTHGVEVEDDTLSDDLEFLRELELVDLVGEGESGHYALAIPLMGKWIGRQHDFEVLKNKARMETEDNHG
ncbi:MAG: N-6 DNA methylase [Desulfocapsaceae bacterium]|nr:N-6 DNA methylase [Desulfocapsaceae bacterium]